jgi:hypothetical protein
MRIVDLFAGLEGWSESARGEHTVVSTDLDPRFETDITADVLEPDLGTRIVERPAGARPPRVPADVLGPPSGRMDGAETIRASAEDRRREVRPLVEQRSNSSRELIRRSL